MIYEKFSFGNTNVHVVVVRRDELHRVYVTNAGRRTVSQVADDIDANLIINGGDYGLSGVPSGKPNSITVSDGRVVQPVRYDSRPYFMFSKSVPVRISHDFSRYGYAGKIDDLAYNTISSDRYVVISKVFNSAIRDRYNRDARTAIGNTENGDLIVVVADGDSSKQIGLNFPELATVFIERGAVHAINLDGGGSTAMWLDGQIVNVPNDDGKLGERAVVNHLCVWWKEENKMTFEQAYEKYSDDEFLEFDEVENKLSKRADVHAFILLDRLVPDSFDMVGSAEHDEIYLDVDVNKLNKVATEAQMVELIRCGVRYDEDTDSLCMFV